MKAGTIKVNYEITTAIVTDKYFGETKAYGIIGEDLSNGETFAAKTVSYDKKFAEKLVLLLEKHQVSISHAKDVIRDVMDEIFEYG